jgi:hypothetical protein
MSDPTHEKKLKRWLLENYTEEVVFMDEVVKTVNEMYQRGGLGGDLKENEDRSIEFKFTKRPETQFAELKMDTPALLFLIGMVKGISAVTLKEILPNLEPETKTCSGCGTANNNIANYCYQCGNRFEPGK